jgi:hypothetical protein
MKLKIALVISLFLILSGAAIGQANPPSAVGAVGASPILVVSVDKLDSRDVFENTLPELRRLLDEGSCGLMSVRSRFGYAKTNSGYLTLGSGSRCAVTEKLQGLLATDQKIAGVTARDFWSWGATVSLNEIAPQALLVPEVGYTVNLARRDYPAARPGLLGKIFHRNAWQTRVYGNSDRFMQLLRPAGLLLMDQQGMVDGGVVDDSLTTLDPEFPFLRRLDGDRAFEVLKTVVKPRQLIVFDFSDLAKLDFYRGTMLSSQYQLAKQATLQRLDRLIGRILDQWSPQEISLLLVSPSISMEAINDQRLLAPIVIRASDYTGGILTSGTTNWPGIVSNTDFLPTLLKLARLSADRQLDGRAFQIVNGVGREERLNRIHQRINAVREVQRPILDWYIGIITFGWLLGYAGIYFKWGLFSKWLLTGITVIPLTLILMPLLPSWSWGVAVFLGFTAFLTGFLILIPEMSTRFLVLTLATWSILTLDQATGWSMIRFSPLGYSPAAGARYYGIGNEFMGVFLPLSLLLAELVYQKFQRRWSALLILSCSVAVLGWPQLGINFGGTLAAVTGFSFYLFSFYQWNFENKKLWLTIGGGLVLVMMVGYWDALRAPELQTHIGRFFGLIFSNRFGRIFLIMERKLAMNLKLLVVSPWARLIWLSLGLTIVNRLLTKKALIPANLRLVGKSMVITGLAALIFNDSGIVAFATGLAFSFSWLLLAFEEQTRRSWFVARRLD